MAINGNGEATVIELINASGEVINKPCRVLSPQQAEIFRAYQRIKKDLGILEANYCQKCWNSTREDGMKGHVTDGEIALECRCRTIVYRGLM